MTCSRSSRKAVPVKVSYDSSALLTLILQEQDWQGIEGLLNKAEVENYIPTPALTEIVVRARENGNQSSPEQLREFFETYGVTFIDLTPQDALRASELIEISRANPGQHWKTGARLTLSLGDALILAISERVAANVLSKDSYWTTFADLGVLDVKVVSLLRKKKP